jgi:hypothetical protein
MSTALEDANLPKRSLTERHHELPRQDQTRTGVRDKPPILTPSTIFPERQRCPMQTERGTRGGKLC